MRLIDADELMMQFFQPPEFTVCPPDICHDNVAVDAYKRGWNDAIEAIVQNEPTVEPKRGKWIRPLGSPRCSYRYQCSECGEVAYQVTGNCGRKVKVPEPCCSYRYCPNCGAKMEET